MLIVMTVNATKEEVEQVKRHIEALGLTPHAIPGAQRVAIGITGNRDVLDPSLFENLPGVLEVIPVSHPYKLVSREVKPEDTVVWVGGVPVGGGHFAVMAGPCSVEGPEQTLTTAQAVKKAGAHILRGGAFKPRTSPYTFQGLGEPGLQILRDVSREVGMPTVSEALDERSLELVVEYCDMIQIGARNMQNFSLLRLAGKARKPVLLKRGMAATVEELLMAAEYLLAEGNYQVVLCERGIRTFTDHTRNTLDLAAVVAVQRLSHLPIIVDPSHGTGKRHKVVPLARAAAAVGADGLMIEVHHNPMQALSDRAQAIVPEELAQLMNQLPTILPLTGRHLAQAQSAAAAS
ncbi:MAG: 3-deoxy-7-phosphoheptulonate synthase [Acidobacteriota bacterium]|jgi:3-deoxy-7-phosphoheptulonate synthase|uniref:3-deoxy-7-phosphoheptulonate synthase n=1 Tax=Thermoanaerobaculum aquaticum TaxID=1312852 RepID=A0A062Y1R7_9BACT|nr:3-deoxy-7-phosphoheptulonate synthase [Thermoanaerobaculum aquaticum]KDA54720.1 3-deoxy-7-phosphoheptulonate synthase [Thermoanaerobaculum aquaticum]BCW93013.1 MAG: 3-deoxy-7-phosphoheptulonate synthase [Thermoanaerobaculum sp.]